MVRGAGRSRSVNRRASPRRPTSLLPAGWWWHSGLGTFELRETSPCPVFSSSGASVDPIQCAIDGGYDSGSCITVGRVPSDEQLVAAAGDGDREAFGLLVVRRQQRPFNVAWRMLGNMADAEEVAQEAFLKILDAADCYRPTARFTTFLYQIVSRLCIDRLRKKQPSGLGDASLQAAGDATPREAADLAEQSAAVRRAMEGGLGRALHGRGRIEEREATDGHR
jgi:hypothetical protein